MSLCEGKYYFVYMMCSMACIATMHQETIFSKVWG